MFRYLRVLYLLLVAWVWPLLDCYLGGFAAWRWFGVYCLVIFGCLERWFCFCLLVCGLGDGCVVVIYGCCGWSVVCLLLLVLRCICNCCLIVACLFCVCLGLCLCLSVLIEWFVVGFASLWWLGVIVKLVIVLFDLVVSLLILFLFVRL